MPAPRALVGLVVALLTGLLIGPAGLIGFSPSAHAATATVTGRFVTEDGAPIDAVRAVLVQNSVVVTEATSGADGTFEITGVTPGSYTLDASDWFDNYGLFTDVPLVLGDGETKAVGDIELTFSTWTSPNTRLTGIVRDPSGKPARGIQVLAKAVTPLETFGQAGVGGFGVTDRTGRFNIDSDGAGGLPVPGTYKLAFTDHHTLLDETFTYDKRYSGDQPTWARATTVTIGATSQTVGEVTVTRFGGISGTLTGTVPMTSGTVTVFNADGEQVATKATGAGGAYTITTLRPGSYYVRFSSTDPLGFIRTWWPGAASMLGATPVTVKSGAFRAAVNQQLSDQLTAFKKPAITGRPVVGATLTASSGSWSLTSGTEYSYEWLRGAGVVGTARTYRPVAADAGKALSVRVTARNLDKAGTTTSAPTATVKWVSTVTARSSYTRSTKRLTLTVRVAVPGLANPGGTVTVKEGSRTVKAGVTVRNGVAVITVLRPRPGAHTYALRYSGTSKVLADTGSIRVSVPR